MSCHCSKECDAHQNSSFVFGLILGLIIGAIVAVVIYRRSKGKVFDDLKKYFEKLFNTSSEDPPSKKDVVIPSTLVATKTEIKSSSKSKPRTFKK